MRRFAALLLVAALVAGGCGSGDQQETVVSPVSTQPAPASTVAEVPTIVVPDFVGQTSEYARGVLDVLGLTIYVEESSNVTGEPDVIVSQLPAAGTAVTPGSLVMVTVPAPQIRKPTLGLSAAAEQLLSETENLKAGHAATIRAASVLEQNPDITHNPFAVIVKFEDGQTDEEINASLTAIGGTRVGKPLGLDNLFLVETLANPAEAVVSLRSETAVEEAGLDYVVHTTDITNDPEVGKQWGLVQAPGLDMSNAWAIATGTAEVVVAVIDTGIQLDHPDLASNIWVNPGEVANNNVDDDNNGFIDDVHGWDFWNWDNDPDDDDEDGHGTHVAGTIGAVINNGVGVSGIAPNVRLMALKVFNAHGDAYSNDIYSALEYAVTNGAQISNNSYGSYGENPKMGALIDAAARVGHVFVSAAGNEENNNDISPSFPASYPNSSIISVGATDQSGQMASFSNYGGESVDVAAPGRDILSTINNSGYGWMSGTSMAAPHVTGLVALMRSIEPNLTSSAIREILIETSRPDTRLQNLVVSDGLVDAAAAVRAITQSLIPTTTAPVPTTTRATPTTTPVPTTTRATPTTTPVPTTTRATPTTTTTAAPSSPSIIDETFDYPNGREGDAYSGAVSFTAPIGSRLRAELWSDMNHSISMYFGSPQFGAISHASSCAYLDDCPNGRLTLTADLCSSDTFLLNTSPRMAEYESTPFKMRILVTPDGSCPSNTYPLLTVHGGQFDWPVTATYMMEGLKRVNPDLNVDCMQDGDLSDCPSNYQSLIDSHGYVWADVPCRYTEAMTDVCQWDRESLRIQNG
jgi:subtilisin family serine protease